MLIFVLILAILFELVDSSLGMMYGTLLSPTLILLGFDTKLVVPSIVISQALGGAVATFRHSKYKSANFSGMTRDTKIVLAVVIPGLMAVFLGVFVAVRLPTNWLNLYIALLVIAMGVLCIRPVYYKFAWWKMWMIGWLSAFNKALSGGGYGPVTSTGKVLGGLDAKTSVATTTFAEVPICLASFVLWYFMSGKLSWALPIMLCLGGGLGGFIGPYITYKFNSKWLKMAVGVLAIACGVLVLALRMKV